MISNGNEGEINEMTQLSQPLLEPETKLSSKKIFDASLMKILLRVDALT